MRLNDLNNKVNATQALKENYKMAFNLNKMSLIETKAMLKKVRSLANEAKQAPDFYKDQSNPSYMKLVFMEQALVTHHNQLMSKPSTRIVVENEKIEESQVYLAAQDLVDTVQKMLEDVGQMQVKELPALVTSIESEIGVNESQTFNEQVTQQLDALSATLKESMAGLKSAVSGLTGQDAGMAFNEPPVDDAEMGADIGADLGAEMGADLGADLGAEEEEIEAPEPKAVAGVGRAKR
jgi:hypothetical protein